MDLAALLDSAATPSPVPPARTPRVSRLTKKDKQLRRSLLKNKARSKYVVGEARRASKRAEVKAQREDKRMNNLLARRPGLLEAVEEVTASSSSLAPVRTPKKKPTVGQLRRAERLKQYKEEKATRLAEKKNNSRPPFLVGVYKLDGKMPARTKTPLSASSTRTKRQTISSAKPEPSAERKLPTRVRRGLFASKSNSGKKRSLLSPCRTMVYSAFVSVPHERSLPGPPTKSLSSITLKNQTKVSQKRQVTNRVNKQRHPVSRSDTGPQNGEGEITPHVEVAPVASPEVEVKEGRSLSKAKSNPDPEPEKIPPQSQAKATVRRRSARIAAAANEQEVSNDHKSGGHCLERKVQKNVVANTPRRRSARISVETTHEDEGGPRSKKSRKPVTASSPAAPRKPRRPSCVAVTPLLSVAEEVEDERREEDVKSGRNDGDAVLLSPLSPERVEKLGGSLKPTTSLTPGLNALNSEKTLLTRSCPARIQCIILCRLLTVKENRRKDGGRPSVVYAFDPLLPLNFNFADAAARDKEGTPSQAEDPEKHSDDFKTPTLSVRKRRRRPSQFSLLLDPLRHDLEFQRGSHSDQRRKKKGQSPFDAEKSFGFDQIIPDDPSSPVHDQLRYVTRRSYLMVWCVQFVGTSTPTHCSTLYMHACMHVCIHAGCSGGVCSDISWTRSFTICLPPFPMQVNKSKQTREGSAPVEDQ